MLVRQVNEGRHEVENQYSRAVTREGNRRANGEVSQIFEMREQPEWRGLGLLPVAD
ncbi:hydrogenase expression/formation protein HypD [Bradyrhizobium sp. JR3.5]